MKKLRLRYAHWLSSWVCYRKEGDASYISPKWFSYEQLKQYQGKE